MCFFVTITLYFLLLVCQVTPTVQHKKDLVVIWLRTALHTAMTSNRTRRVITSMSTISRRFLGDNGDEPTDSNCLEFDVSEGRYWKNTPKLCFLKFLSAICGKDLATVELVLGCFFRIVFRLK